MENIVELDQAAKAELAQLAQLPEVTVKEKRTITPQEAAELDPISRRTSMDESSLGFTEAQARLEASRCLKCKKPACTPACPIGMPIPEYLE